MLNEQDKQRICEISRKYHAQKVLLFGSSLQSEQIAGDIDLAVEGIRPEDFLLYYGELMIALSKPVDVIDLAGDSRFKRLVRSEGAILYG